jgi:hypothetical protein
MQNAILVNSYAAWFTDKVAATLGVSDDNMAVQKFVVM